MISILRKLWKMFSRIAYKGVSFVLGIFRITISDEKWQQFMQFVKFGIVGVSNTIIDYVAYLIALHIFEYFGLFGDKAYIPSNVIGLFVSVTNAFYWNYTYVFGNEKDKETSKLKAYIKTVLSYSITGLGLKTILLYLFITVWGMSDIIAPIAIMFIVVPINFMMNKLWAFRRK